MVHGRPTGGARLVEARFRGSLSFISVGFCGTARSSQGRAGFARRSGPLTARTVLQAVGGKKGSRSPAVLISPGEQTSFPPVLQAVTFTSDVNGRRMVQQPIQNRSRDYRIAKDGTPVSVAFVGGKDNAAAFVTSADQLKEDGCAMSSSGR